MARPVAAEAAEEAGAAAEAAEAAEEAGAAAVAAEAAEEAGEWVFRRWCCQFGR